MAISKELLCCLQITQQNLGRLLNLESQIAKSATLTPMIIQVVPIYSSRYKHSLVVVIMEDFMEH
jgi:hypothetical protein